MQLEIALEIDHKLSEGNALGNLGLALSDIGDYKGAILHYERHLKIAREIGHKRGEANSKFNIVTPLLRLNKVKDAIRYLESAKILFLEMGVDVWVQRCDTKLSLIETS